jgi:O-antigen/teichoic acid export membrane protein
VAIFRGRDPRTIPLFREGIWVLIGQVGVMTGALVGIRLITGVVPPALYGEAALVLGMVMLVKNVFCAPVLQGSFRFYAQARDAGGVAPFRRVAMGLLGRGLAISCGLLLSAGLVWRAWPDREAGLLAFLVACVLLCLNVMRLLEAGLFNQARRRRHHGLWNAFDAWVRPASVVAFVWWLGASVESMIAGHATGAALSNLVFRRNLVRDTRTDVEPPTPEWSLTLRKDLLHFALPLAPIAVLIWIMSLSDRYVLAALAGSDAAGLYVAAYGLSSRPLLAFAGIANITFLPLLYDAVAREDVRRERRVILSWLGITGTGLACAVLLLALFHEPIVRVALGERFWAASPLLPWIGAAYAFWGGQQIFECLMYAHGRTRLLAFSHAAGAVSALVLYFLLIPRLGALGAAIGTLCSLGLSCGVTFVLSRAPALFAGRGAGAGGSAPGSSGGEAPSE